MKSLVRPRHNDFRWVGGPPVPTRVSLPHARAASGRHLTRTRRAALRPSRTRDLGLDVHQEASAVAYVAHDHGAEGTSLGTMGTRPCDRDPRVRTRPSTATPLVCVEEAGPCGSWLERALTNTGEQCGVVAPAWMPTNAGARVHTDRRDAVPRARLRRAGARTPVDGPTVDEAAMRDRTRARDATSGALQAATCRLNACRRRHAMRDTGRATGGPRPPALARGRGRCPPGAATRRPGRCPGGARAHRTPAASRTRTPRAGAPLASAAGGRGPASLAGRARPRGCHQRRGPGCSAAR